MTHIEYLQEQINIQQQAIATLAQIVAQAIPPLNQPFDKLFQHLSNLQNDLDLRREAANGKVINDPKISPILK